jgi:hypothetical protein
MLFRQDLVGPLHEAHEHGWIRKGGVLSREIRFEDPTGPRTRPSNVDRNLALDDLRETLVAQVAHRDLRGLQPFQNRLPARSTSSHVFVEMARADILTTRHLKTSAFGPASRSFPRVSGGTRVCRRRGAQRADDVNLEGKRHTIPYSVRDF